MLDIPLTEIKRAEADFIINTYRRDPAQNLFIVRGRGCRVWDETGKEYLDFVSGLAVNSLGHCHPAVVAAVKEQAEQLIHTSNLYYTEPQVQLAFRLVNSSFGERVFFANSGAEANEAAIKLARKYSKKKYGDNRYRIITAERSFHGRTLATVAATAQPKYHEGFAPLPEGFDYAEFNDIASFATLMSKDTCAIIIEPVQGEGGVYPARAEFLQELRHLCDEKGVLLIFDEVQCGMGRTGHLWAHQAYGVDPDIMTVAKALGGGLPIGAMIATAEVAEGFSPGDHASTFGGNPVACRAASVVMDVISDEAFLSKVRQKGDLLRQALADLRDKNPSVIAGVRGMGLMLAIELAVPEGARIQKACQNEGVLVNLIGEQTIRLLPPLVVAESEIKVFLDLFARIIDDV